MTMTAIKATPPFPFLGDLSTRVLAGLFAVYLLGNALAWHGTLHGLAFDGSVHYDLRVTVGQKL